MKKRLAALLAAAALCAWTAILASAVEFLDVGPHSSFAQPIAWAVEQGIAAGKTESRFDPTGTCSTAHILTFIWRAEGRPEPTAENPFTDLSEDHYSYKAALWAYEQGLIKGPAFQGAEPCSRGSAVLYLWKLVGSPKAAQAVFFDVPEQADYAPAVSWAVEQGIMNGMGDGNFHPDANCNRQQIVAILYRLSMAQSRAESSAPSVPEESAAPQEPAAPRPLSVSGVSVSKVSSIAGEQYQIQFQISAGAAGGTGEGYQYQFEILQNGEVTQSTSWGGDNGISGWLSGSGSCVLRITVKDSSGATDSEVCDLLQR